MSDAVTKYKDNLDWSIVVSTITAAVIIGAAAYGLRKAGLGTVANVIK
ncbi:hypothetical protein [Billgrantia bachuensis]|uniref:Uncharacterized protein n=1 Tax=Billgrantia bachuensis TaxID=2717286 RepID=A0ABX0PLI0_9GAMM|nr:hypothetical protein [Halomonas bachuensis]NIC03978.1 hypothetical protein [Halomonas bachuensis]